MTVRSVTYLKGRFENLKIPTATDYEDVFDSFLSLEASGTQTFNGGIVTPELVATRVSALAANFVNAVSGNAAYFSSVNVTNASASNLYLAAGLFLDVATSVNALATTQTSSVTISNTITFVANGDGDNTAVRLPTSTQGRVQYIINAAATAIKVFPAVSGLFVTTVLNASQSIPAGKTMIV